MGILVFGSLNIDSVTYLERMPLPGETVMGDRFETFPGGKGGLGTNSLDFKQHGR